MAERKYFTYYFILFFTWSSVFSLNTIYMNEVVGVDLKTIGIFASSLPLIGLVFQPIWGSLADSTQKPKAMLTGLMMMTAILAIAVTITPGKHAVLLVYCVYFIFLCGQGPLSDGMAVSFAHSSPERSYGSIRAFGSAGYAFGAFLVSRLAQKWGLAWIFYIAAVGFIVSLFTVRKLENPPLTTEKRNYKEDIRSLLKEKQYLFILIYGFLLVGSFFGADQYQNLYTRNFGADVSVIGTITFISVCIEMPFIFYSRRLIKRFNALNMLLFMNAVSIARMLLLGISWHIGVFYIAGIMRGLIVGIFVPLFIELISEVTPKTVINSAVSIYNAISTGIAVFLFTFVGSRIANAYGYPFLYTSYGIFQIVPLILLAMYVIVKKNSRVST